MRRLTAKWDTGTGWPKRLEWVQIDGLRGWRNEKFTLNYPIMENATIRYSVKLPCRWVEARIGQIDFCPRASSPVRRNLVLRRREGEECHARAEGARMGRYVDLDRNLRRQQALCEKKSEAYKSHSYCWHAPCRPSVHPYASLRDGAWTR